MMTGLIHKRWMDTVQANNQTADYPTHCPDCGVEFEYMFVTDDQGAAMCLTCFERKHPRHAGANRLKGSNEQLELPL